jgi:hypothetical protein
MTYIQATQLFRAGLMTREEFEPHIQARNLQLYHQLTAHKKRKPGNHPQTAKRDLLIEQEYYRQAQGRQISLLDIPNLYNAVQTAMDGGETLVQAMANAIDTYCRPSEVQP